MLLWALGSTCVDGIALISVNSNWVISVPQAAPWILLLAPLGTGAWAISVQPACSTCPPRRLRGRGCCGQSLTVSLPLGSECRDAVNTHSLLGRGATGLRGSEGWGHHYPTSHPTVPAVPPATGSPAAPPTHQAHPRPGRCCWRAPWNLHHSALPHHLVTLPLSLRVPMKAGISIFLVTWPHIQSVSSLPVLSPLPRDVSGPHTSPLPASSS